MSTLGAFLMLWGLSLGPATEAAVVFDPTPDLWAEAELLLKPWAGLTLVCQARLKTLDFELLKDGVTQELVHLDLPAMEHRFPLGAVTSDTRGLYRCRSGLESGWTQLSNLLEVTGAESLSPPLLSPEPVSWITRGLKTKLVCRGGFRGVTFLLRREGDDQFLEVAEAPKDIETTFTVLHPGNYSCSYRTHEAGTPSEPSATVTVEELVNPVALGNGGLYTCRYRLRGEQIWSPDSAPVELLLSDETLPAPELSAEPAMLHPAPGALVQLRCRAPRAGLRFALMREDAKRRVYRILSPAGTEATFELRDVSVVDSANYSCVYVDMAPPFEGSAPSAHLELRVAGTPLRPQLRPLWSGAVVPGRDAILRCEGQLPEVTFELLRAGEEEPITRLWSSHPSADLVVTYVGPKHAANYSCRYRWWSPKPFVSKLSDPVELQVAGELFLWFCELGSSFLPLPRLCPLPGGPLPCTSSQHTG
ncbi:alpha-1B-glycoprotein isoform X4 [Mustela putorius furo]|uniref:Alpha-1B-glycoprotein isoform X4 n=1 Tax=Mustela putorius furo TaxID=9669 RepID=A0A8U0NN77_MUSPF|nr:alpha-1B-glycoprotein isoform X4 [Mustela putorius furo]